MQRNPSPILTPNTFRDSNDNASAIPPQDIFHSTTTHEQMNPNKAAHHSIVQPVESDKQSIFIDNNSSSNTTVKKPPFKSIVRSADSGNEELIPQQVQPVPADNLVNVNSFESQACGFDPTRSDDMDPDEAFALRLQQEEYARESFRPIRFPYHPFDTEQDSDPEIAFPPHSNDGNFTNDAEFAAFLQAQEDRQRRQRDPFRMMRQREGLNNESNENRGANQLHPPTPPALNRPGAQPPENNANDSDDDGHRTIFPFPFFHIPGREGGPSPEDLFAFLASHRRNGRRRTGNLEETEDDFGPEDYERLIQLDDKIPKKKLSKQQIDAISRVTYHRKPDSNDEENKCSVCLESFEENQQLREYPCKHLYHQTCGDRWLRENNVCPICREPPIKTDASKESRSSRDFGYPRHTTTTHSRIATNRRPTHRNDNNNNNNSNNVNNNAQRNQHRRERPS